jgi:hypothetical protein
MSTPWNRSISQSNSLSYTVAMWTMWNQIQRILYNLNGWLIHTRYNNISNCVWASMRRFKFGHVKNSFGLLIFVLCPDFTTSQTTGYITRTQKIMISRVHIHTHTHTHTHTYLYIYIFFFIDIFITEGVWSY